MRRPLDPRDIPDELRRRLGLLDAVVIGLGSMIGAGIFAALAPAAYAAGSGLLLGLAVAAVVAYCNAISSARLAARYPASGGTYVYGRMRLGDFWGYLAGWGFVVGKTASCAAMALTVGFYVWPAQAHAVAVAVVVALTAVNYAGIQKSAWLTRSIVAVVLVVLTAVVVAAYGSGAADPARLDIGVDAHVWGMLQAAGLLFFAFAGYAARNIPAFDDLPVPADTANLREGADLNNALLALLPLVGVWRGEGEGRGPDGDYRFGQQIVVSHDGGDYLNWESRSWRLTATGDYQEPGLREAGFWRFVADPYDPSESQAIELLLAHSAGYVELFYGRPRTQSSWELVTDALARSRSGVLVGGAKRLYGIVEGGDLAYVEERVDADGGLVPHLSARLSRFVG